MITTDIKQLEINYLTEDQYNTAKSAGTLDENALYMTEGTSIEENIHCHATATSSSLSLSAGTITTVPLNTLSINNPAGFFTLDTSSNGVKCGKTGTVLINGSVYVTSSTSGNMGVYIKRGSSEIACALGYNNTVSSVSKIITVAAGDVITLNARSANTGTCVPNNYGTYLDIIYLDEDALYVTEGDVADYIVERGTSGIWTYEKWASGKAVCYGYDTKTVGCTTAYGSLYGGSTTISLPSGLFLSDSISNIHVTTGGSTGSGYAFFGRYASVTNTGFSALFLSTASASKDITFSAEVKGKWK